MKIFLIGFMGCGKSTLGKKLAAKLDYPLVDLDHQLEKISGKTIAGYFSEKGEDAFRKFESDTLQSFNYPSNCVIATGGGTPCYFDNMNWMNANGVTVYIEMTATALAKRLENGLHKRPLLRDLTENELIAFIEGKLEERRDFYTRAKLIMEGINLTPDNVKAAISAGS